MTRRLLPRLLPRLRHGSWTVRYSGDEAGGYCIVVEWPGFVFMLGAARRTR